MWLARLLVYVPVCSFTAPPSLPPSQSMTLTEAEEKLLTILKQVMEEKLTSTNIEMASIAVGDKFSVYSKEKLEAIIARIKS